MVCFFVFFVFGRGNIALVYFYIIQDVPSDCLYYEVLVCG